MDMYSPDGAALLMQGDAKTVVYAAMYSEGEYLGAIAYVVCGSKRFWTKQSRKELGEITKIINAYLTKHLAANAINRGMMAAPDFDRLTGLLSFGRFREEIEHKIVGGYADGHIIVYSDFENFKYFNEKYGYAVGDQVLKEFSNYLVAGVRAVGDVYMTRVAGDQFAVYLPYRKPEDSTVFVERMNRVFERQQAEKYPEASLRLRSGIYEIEPDCLSASAAIDKANFARKQLRPDSRVSVLRYDRQMGERQTLANELTNGLNRAMERGEFKLYLQPKFSLKDFSVIGAEALVRWEREDGTVLYPDQFIPILETTGRIVDLDLYMFEQVAEFLKRGIQDGLRLFPIAVNASVALAKDPENARRLRDTPAASGQRRTAGDRTDRDRRRVRVRPREKAFRLLPGEEDADLPGRLRRGLFRAQLRGGHPHQHREAGPGLYRPLRGEPAGHLLSAAGGEHGEEPGLSGHLRGH